MSEVFDIFDKAHRPKSPELVDDRGILELLPTEALIEFVEAAFAETQEIQALAQDAIAIIEKRERGADGGFVS